VREAWRLDELKWRATPLSHEDLDAIADSTRPSTDQLADLHDRLDLIDKAPRAPTPLVAAPGDRLQSTPRTRPLAD
jgi:hypothetical protein